MNKLSSFIVLLLFVLPAAGQSGGDFKFNIPDSRLQIPDFGSQSSKAAIGTLPAGSRQSSNGRVGGSFWVLAGITGGLVAADVASSQGLFRLGSHESWSGWEMGRQPGVLRMSATLGTEAALWSFAAYRLDRHGRHKLARLFQLAEVGIEAAAVISNSVRLGSH